MCFGVIPNGTYPIGTWRFTRTTIFTGTHADTFYGQLEWFARQPYFRPQMIWPPRGAFFRIKCGSSYFLGVNLFHPLHSSWNFISVEALQTSRYKSRFRTVTHPSNTTPDTLRLYRRENKHAHFCVYTFMRKVQYGGRVADIDLFTYFIRR